MEVPKRRYLECHVFFPDDNGRICLDIVFYNNLLLLANFERDLASVALLR